MTPTKNIIFLHIPKNGGTTFDTILDKNNPIENTFNIHPIGNGILNDQEFIKLPFSEREKINLLKGHMNFGFHQYLVGKSNYITLLRRPEERVISYFYFVLNLPNYPLHKRVKDEKMSLYDFVTKINQTDVNNAQIRIISGINDTEELMLEKAIYNLENHFSFVGLVEKFNESLVLLKKTHQLKNLYYKTLNKTPKRVEFTKIDSKTHDAIAELNKGDNLLYNKMEKKFNQEIANIEMIKTQLFKLHIYNSLFKLYSNNVPDFIKLKIRQTLITSK